MAQIKTKFIFGLFFLFEAPALNVLKKKKKKKNSKKRSDKVVKCKKA